MLKAREQEASIEEAKIIKRQALIHIPIEENEIAGEPFLNRDDNESHNMQCFREPVSICGQLSIAYVGELRRITWRNMVVKKKLTLKRRREEEDSESEDDDFVKKALL